MTGFAVPGFDVDRLLRRDWAGELWAARGRATGRPVLLRRLPVADDVATHDRARRGAARLTGVEHPHLVPVQAVLSVEGAVVLVHDQVAGVGLDRALAQRRHLTAAEVVTLAVPIAQALDAVHACGLVHGRIGPSCVLLVDDGRPLLADTGVAALLDLPERALTPPDDVRDLALICRAALDPAGAGPLSAVLDRAADDDPGQRPTAAQLAAEVFAAGTAAPIELTAGPAAPLAARSPQSHRRRPTETPPRSRPRWVAALVTVLAAVAAALTGLAWAGADAGAPGSVVAPPAAASTYDVAAVAARWRAVLSSLDARRAEAFASVDLARLRAVYAEDAPALRRDREQLTALAAAGLRVQGLQLRTRSVRVVTSGPGRVELAVVDVLAPYAVRSQDSGDVVSRRNGRGAADWRVTLVRGPAGWRIYEVVGAARG